MLTEGFATSSALLTTIRPLILAQGWSEPTSGNFVSPTVAGRTLNFTVQSVSTASLNIVTETVIGVNKTFYIAHSSTSNSGLCFYRVFVGDSWIFIQVRGPMSGAVGDPGARITSSFGMFPLTPYYVGDTTASQQVVVVGVESNASTQATANAYVRTGNSVGWSSGRLMTMRPAVQDIAASGDNQQGLDQQSSRTFWPFVFADNTSGLRGRLEHVYMASDNYQLVGDTGSHANVRATINGSNHRAVAAFRCSGSSSYSPFGAMGDIGGPVIMVRE